MPTRNAYPTDVSDEEWAFVAPYLALVRKDAPQRVQNYARSSTLCAGLCALARFGGCYPTTSRLGKPSTSRRSGGSLPASSRRWSTTCGPSCAWPSGRAPNPTAAVLDSRTLRSTPESGHRGGYDGTKRKKGSKVHAAVDTLGHLLALRVTPATEQDRTQVEALAEAVQEDAGESVELA